MNGKSAGKCQTIDPFWENMLNQAKIFRAKDVPPEAYRALVIQLDKSLSSACLEMAGRLRERDRLLHQMSRENI